MNAQTEPYDYGLEERCNIYEQEYGKDTYDKKPYGNSYEQESNNKDRDKSKKDSRSDLLKKLKCNNINANLNNVDANFGSPVEDDTTGADGTTGEAITANELMNGGRDGDRSLVDRENDFAFVCINNNENVVIGEGEEPTSELCEERFAANSAFQTKISDTLVEFEGLSVLAMRKHF
jgi:hypothetical protein